MKGKVFIRMINRINNLFDKIGVYLLAVFTVAINISLAFDNVVWGDEAYSQMAIKSCDLYGIYQRVYYWDSHPPFYYYYLRLFADLFGYKTVVYHMASLVPFIIGIVLAVTLLKKQLGAFPAAFFIVVSGLSQSCVEYNLEIRMYSLVFMFVLLCAYCALQIIKDGSKKVYFVLMTLFGIFAAYTHYYGLAVCGLIIFYTGLANFLTVKKAGNFVKWLVSTLVYIVVYIPWLFVLYFQTQAELGNSWMTEPDPLWNVLKFITGGDRLCYIILIFSIVMSIVVFLSESNIIHYYNTNGKKTIKFDLKSFSIKSWSYELKCILLNWAVIVSLLGFGYCVSYIFHPILTYRYTYVLIPLTMIIFIFCVKKFLEGSTFEGLRYGVVWGMFVVVLLLALFDFKYFRSVTKTQEYQTQLILDKIGVPNKDTVFVANNVKHLGWSVLQYYYGDNDISIEAPNKVSAAIGYEPGDIWAFNGIEYDEELINNMEEWGYSCEVTPGMWMGKYGVNLYHFYR